MAFTFSGPVQATRPAARSATSAVDRLCRRLSTVTRSRASVSSLVSQSRCSAVMFERQIAPFAVAELRLHQELAAHGLEVDDKKVRFYVTDTLDDPNVEMLSSPFVYKPIADSGIQARRVKTDERVMVVMGNPPYLERAIKQAGLILSAHKGRSSLLDSFRGDGTGRVEFKLHNLNVYFWRWATWKVFEAHAAHHPEGVVAFISTAAYTTGPGFAGMRRYLRQHADWGWIIDLSPEGHQPDVPTRIFPEVQQPICIGIFARNGAADPDVPAQVRYIAVAGTQEEKFERLSRLGVEDASWLDCPTTWSAPFRPASLALWNDCVALADLMPWSSPGIKPNRTWVYAPDRATLIERWRLFLLAEPEDRPSLMKETRDRTARLKIEPQFDGTGAPRSLADARLEEPEIARVALRSFDRQYVIADRRVVDFPRPGVWAVHNPKQVYATTLFSEPLTAGPAIVFAAEVPDMHHLIGHHGGKVLPLYRNASAEVDNVAPGLRAMVGAHLGMDISPEDILAYIAAIASHDGYTQRFQSELRSQGPRIPITADSDLWSQAVSIGRKIVWLHTYGNRFQDASVGQTAGPPRHLRPRVIMPIPGDEAHMPESIHHTSSDQALHVGTGILRPVTDAVWTYQVSGMHVIKRWFEYRSRTPRVRWSSPLNDTVASTWDFTDALRDLVAVLQGCVNLAPEQASLLARVLDRPLINTASFEAAGVLPPPLHATRPLINDRDTLF